MNAGFLLECLEQKAAAFKLSASLRLKTIKENR